MNRLGDRIRILRCGRDLTQQALADELGVSRSAIAMWEKGEREPNLETLEALAKIFSVPLSVLVERSSPELPANVIPVTRRRIPLLGAIAAGEPIFAEQSYETYVDVGGSVHADFALEVQGDSMEPLYKNGDIVFIRKQDDVRDGQVAAVVIDDGATLKRVYHLPIGVQLMPINPAYEPMLFTAENSAVIRILGLAVGYFRRTV